eukprot:TRINITY_DN39275_c0_g1_i1.p1 TRINITY_DN39275_c0_g1~~TRINITY_DN39275_c0_g1_i1.p1  ORF type:complete len:180 (+),score=79.36 TRINITY_DN39275_c0_g1_i1:73-612(+)
MDQKAAIVFALTLVAWVFGVAATACEGCLSGDKGGVFKTDGHDTLDILRCDDAKAPVRAEQAFCVMTLLLLSFLWIYHLLEVVGKAGILGPVAKFVIFVHIVAAVFAAICWLILVIFSQSTYCDVYDMTEADAGKGIYLWVVAMLLEIGAIVMIKKGGGASGGGNNTGFGAPYTAHVNG